MGQTVQWRQAYSCPCVNPNSGAAKPNCPICLGKGKAWDAAQSSVIGISGQKAQQQWAQIGMYEQGDVVVSIPSDSPCYSMGQFDRVLLSNNTQRFSIPLVRGNNDVLRFTYESITAVFWLDPSGAFIIQGGIPTVDVNGNLTWASGAPASGATYTIEGTRFLEYYCYGDFPNARGFFQGETLPRKAILRRFDLFGR